MPVVTAYPAKWPTAVLKDSVAVVKFWVAKVWWPIAVDLLPNVFAPKAS